MNSRYFPHVDGLRALAVLSVIVYHLVPDLLPGGFAGVDIFFVISGFVVTGSLVGHERESLGTFLAGFYSRRLVRIVPALLAMLLLTTLLFVLFVPRSWLGHSAQSAGLAAFWGFSNWMLETQAAGYFEPDSEFNPFTHTWSLGVEEQFYLIAPALLFGWIRQRERPRRRVAWAFLLGGLALLSMLWTFRIAIHYGPGGVFYPLMYRFWELAAGALWFQWAQHRAGTAPRHAAAWASAPWLGLGLVTATLAGSSGQTFPWPWALGAVAGAALLIGDPNRDARDPIRRCLAHPIAVWIGQRSYSLYLWHWPVFVILRWTTGLETLPTQLAALVLTAVLSVVSFHAVEVPLRTSERIRRLRPAVRIPAFLLSILLCWSVAWWSFQSQDRLSLSWVAAEAADWYPGDRMTHFSDSTRPCAPVIRVRFVHNVEIHHYDVTACGAAQPARVFALGDSHASAYRPMLEQLSAATRREVTILELPGCPFIGLVARPTGAAGARCDAGTHAAVDAVLAAARPGDVLFLPSLRLPRLVEQWGTEQGTAGEGIRPRAFARTPGELALIERHRDDAMRALQPFLAAGMQILFEAPKPIFRSPVFRCVDPFNRMNPACRMGLTESRADEEAYREPTLRALREIASRDPRIRLWDPLPILCEPVRCGALRDDKPLFFDADHVSAHGNALLYPAFREAVDAFDGAPAPASVSGGQ